MLKDGPVNAALIRLSIFALRAVAPVSLFYTALRLYQFATCASCTISYQWTADIWLFSEALFFLTVYLPRRFIINMPSAPYMPLATRKARRDVLIKTWDSTPDPHRYLSLYFYGTPVAELSRGDVKEWLVWRLWNQRSGASLDPDELEEYLQYTEDVLQHHFRKGPSEHKSMAVTLDPVRMVHRPLLWYALFVGSADTVACISLYLFSFRFHRYSRLGIFQSLPFRPVLLFSNHKSPSKSFSYWLLPHTSNDKTKLPIVFVHGVGVGLHFYLAFLKDLLPHCQEHGIGILCLEIHQVCSRVTFPLPSPEDITIEMLRILDHHSWHKVVMVTHSYGSVVAAHMLKDALAAARLGPLIFADPVCFSFHPPEVAFNFLRRKPKSASEWQLWYFASMDPDVSRVLTRSFRWSESSLWREDVENRRGERTTVFLAGKDIITDVDTTGAYLARTVGKGKWYGEPIVSKMNEAWKAVNWTGKKSLEVVYSPRLNHAELFEEEEERSLLCRVVKAYTVR